MKNHDTFLPMSAPCTHIPVFRALSSESAENILLSRCYHRLLDYFDHAPPPCLLDRLHTECTEIKCHGLLHYTLSAAELFQYLRGINFSLKVGSFAGKSSLVGWLLGLSDTCPHDRGMLLPAAQPKRRLRQPYVEAVTEPGCVDAMMEYLGQRYGWAHVALQLSPEISGVIISAHPVPERFNAGRTSRGLLVVTETTEDLVEAGVAVIGLTLADPSRSVAEVGVDKGPLMLA